MTIDQFKLLANSFPETYEQPHFEKVSFRIYQKIFATLSDKDHRVTLKLSIEDGKEFFKDVHLIRHKLSVMYDLGLGYLQLGQSATTLSGGEAQRIKFHRLGTGTPG